MPRIKSIFFIRRKNAIKIISLSVDLFSIFFICALLLFLINDRIEYTNEVFGNAISCSNCFTSSIIKHDSIYLSIIFLLITLSFSTNIKYFIFPARIISISMILIYALDIKVMRDFFTRLNIGDVKIYGSQIDIVFRHINETSLEAGTIFLSILTVLLAIVLLLKKPSNIINRKINLILLLIPLFGILYGTFTEPKSYVHNWALKNILASNLSGGVKVSYSDEYKGEIIKAVEKEAPLTCNSGNELKDNIVVLILESWSPYQSKLFSGIHDWTPKLDQLARNNTWYSKLYAGGYSTNEGLISIFTGLDYISPVKNFFHLMPFETAWETKNTIPELLSEKANYHSSFITSGNLSFSSKGKWLKSLGFQYIEGHDYPGYEGMDRLHFDSVPDHILYDRAKNLIGEYTSKNEPFFLAIESVSTHHPYIHPITKSKSQEDVVRYMDETVYEFYENLESEGFFKGGILIIISDHRAMIPILKAEQELMGQASVSLIPAITIGSSLIKRGKVDTAYHQSDLLTSLGNLVSEEFCHQHADRNLFAPDKTQPRCLYHARGNNRDYIDFFCPDGKGTIALNGDETSIRNSSHFSDELRGSIIKEVSKHRIAGDERTRTLIESGYFN